MLDNTDHFCCFKNTLDRGKKQESIPESEGSPLLCVRSPSYALVAELHMQGLRNGLAL